MKLFTAIGVVTVAVRVAKFVSAVAGTWSDPDYVQRSWERRYR